MKKTQAATQQRAPRGARDLDKADEAFGDEGYSRWLFQLYRTRPELQALHDISTCNGRSALFCWLLSQGVDESPDYHPPREWQCRKLAELDGRVDDNPALPVSQLMGHLWFGTPELQARFPLESPTGRHRFVAWFYLVWYARNHDLGLLLSEQLAWLFKRITASGLRRDAWLLWAYIPELQTQFPLRETKSIIQYIDWFSENGTEAQLRLYHSEYGRGETSPVVASAQALPKASPPVKTEAVVFRFL